MAANKEGKIWTEIRLFFTALMFYTRIPPPTWVGYREEDASQSARYFPLIGILVGGIGALVFWLAQWLWPNSVAVILSMITTVAVTGAIHEDGLADTCDGLAGGWSKEQVLAIMKDSSIGVFGTVGLVLILALKFFTLANLPVKLVPFLLVAAHSLSRFVTITFLYTHTYARGEAHGLTLAGDSKSRPMAQKPSLWTIIVAGIFGLLPLLWLGIQFWILILPMYIVKWLLGRYFVKRIGGYTGDCLGTTQQLTEVVFYLGALQLYTPLSF